MRRWAIAALVTVTACAAPRAHRPLLIPSPRADARLEPGDVAPHVTVIGQVQRVGSIRYQPGLTVTGAIVDSGGFTELARKSHVEVRRGRAVHVVSMTAILDGAQPDFVLRADDVVMVAEEYF